MKVLLTGGGSGGHITPVTSIAREIKTINSSTEIIYIGQKNDKLSALLKKNTDLDKVYLIYAGKFRRYHYEGLKQLLDFPTILKNVRDTFLILIGFLQALFIIRKNNPDILFTRGGYLSVPVALAAKLNGVPYITHDSDSISSLTNKIIAPGAKVNAISIDSKHHNYPKNKKVLVGVPVSSEFIHVTDELKNEYRNSLGLSRETKVLLVIGGGLGSVSINQAVLRIAKPLLNSFEDLVIFHIVGIKNLQKMKKEYEGVMEHDNRIKLLDFVDDVYKYSGAADVIVTRAGATNLAEFSIQAKPCIIIPSPYLTGGHQLKNAEFIAEHDAGLIIQEDDIVQKSDVLLKSIMKLLNDDDLRLRLSKNISKIAISGATRKLAELILSESSGGHKI